MELAKSGFFGGIEHPHFVALQTVYSPDTKRQSTMRIISKKPLREFWRRK